MDNSHFGIRCAVGSGHYPVIPLPGDMAFYFVFVVYNFFNGAVSFGCVNIFQKGGFKMRKKDTTKKLQAVLIVAAMVAATTPVSAFAAEDFAEDQI